MVFSADWSRLLDRVAERLTGGDARFFHGQEQQNWELVPALARRGVGCEDELPALEVRLFIDFKIRGGNLLNDEDDAWRVAFLMQHHVLPTRLLDWWRRSPSRCISR